ncbi:MAG: carboxylating nicotinate-nucleotide diphosphorylase [Gemmatimonadota bacterium]|nr:carboxylating nicotinate-nucleotide diphosphorylase [Gemmatimonadota bacterium]
MSDLTEWHGLDRVVDAAIREDVGDGDITTAWTVRPNARARAVLVARESGVIAGLAVAGRVFHRVDARIRVTARTGDGARVDAADVLAEVDGPARGILTAERTALNFLQRMSGIATLASAYVAAVAGTGVRILDTRKTSPGLRMLDKYAVAAGGGTNHRSGLHDMVLLKENHIEAADGIGPAVAAVKSAMARDRRRVMIEVEVKTLRELDDALAAGVDRVMLDNMDLDAIRLAVARVRAAGPESPLLEASGNVTRESVRAVAETGVDLISVGALTHSAHALDMSLLFQ